MLTAMEDVLSEEDHQAMTEHMAEMHDEGAGHMHDDGWDEMHDGDADHMDGDDWDDMHSDDMMGGMGGGGMMGGRGR